MHAYQSPSSDIAYSAEAPILIAASSDAALARARLGIAASGRRPGAEFKIDEAMNRLDMQARVGMLWVEIENDPGGAIDALLGRVSRDVADGRYCAVVSTDRGCLDPVHAMIGDADLEVLVDPSEAERVAAIAIASSQFGAGVRVSDITSDNGAARLRQLSEEVNRIAATLARLSSAPAPVGTVEEPASNAQVPPVNVDRVRAVIRARRLRARFFSEDLFADPAWDMLLDLLQAEISQLRVPVSSLCIAAAVPATTALRWLKAMVARGLFVRRADPHDGRRVFVELAPDTSRAMHRYFAEVDSATAAI